MQKTALALFAATLIFWGMRFLPYPYDRIAGLAGAIIALVLSLRLLLLLVNPEEDKPHKSE